MFLFCFVCLFLVGVFVVVVVFQLLLFAIEGPVLLLKELNMNSDRTWF